MLLRRYASVEDLRLSFAAAKDQPRIVILGEGLRFEDVANSLPTFLPEDKSHAKALDLSLSLDRLSRVKMMLFAPA